MSVKKIVKLKYLKSHSKVFIGEPVEGLIVAPLHSEADCMGVGAGCLRVSEVAVPCAFPTRLLFIFPLCHFALPVSPPLCVGLA